MVSINKKKIALIEKYTQEKLRNKAMKMGVILKSPETVFLSADTKFGKNITIHPYVVIGQKVKIGSDVEILPFSHIENATLEANVVTKTFSTRHSSTGVVKRIEKMLQQSLRVIFLSNNRVNILSNNV